MIQVTILNQQNVVGWQASFETQDQADAWIAQEEPKNYWGKPDRWVRDIENEDMLKTDHSRDVQALDGEEFTEFHFPAEYTVVQTDTTSTLVQEARNLKLEDFRKLRDAELKNADVMINEITLAIRSDVEAVKTYRQALLDFTNDYRYSNDPTRAKVAIDSLDLANITWPTKPE